MGSRAEQPGDRHQLKPAALQHAKDLRQRRGSGGLADVHQDDGAIKLRICKAGDALDEKGAALRRRDGIEAVNRPVNGDVAKIASCPQHASVARPKRSTPPAAHAPRDVPREEGSSVLELGTNRIVRELREIG